MQNKLNSNQISEFYHDLFVKDQVDHFRGLATPVLNSRPAGQVVDIGGGVGHFAHAVRSEMGQPVRVVDLDPVSVAKCHQAGLEAEVGDALNLTPKGDETIVCFNLILHHLVAPSASATRELQGLALRPWRCRLFVNEYIYESYVGNLSGWLIYQITSSQVLSAIGKAVSRLVPAFRANTFGVGVRFRAHQEWVRLFNSEGFRVEHCAIGESERVSLPLRLLCIKTIRRNSFLLVPES